MRNYNYSNNNRNSSRKSFRDLIKSFFYAIGGVTGIAAVTMFVLVPRIENDIKDIKERQKKQIQYQKILGIPAYNNSHHVSSTPVDTAQIQRMMDEYKKTMPPKENSSILNTPIQFDANKTRDLFSQPSVIMPPKSPRTSSFTDPTQGAVKAQIDKMNKDIEMAFRRRESNDKKNLDELLHGDIPTQLKTD